MSGNALSPRSATVLAFGIILLVFLIFMFIYLLPIIRNPRCVQGSWRPTNDEEHKEPKKLPRLSLAIPKTSPFMLRSPLSLLSTSSPITPPPPVYAASSLSRTSPSPDYSSQPPSPRDMKSPRATPFSNGLGTSGVGLSTNAWKQSSPYQAGFVGRPF